jgi:hypothetical protein
VTALQKYPPKDDKAPLKKALMRWETEGGAVRPKGPAVHSVDALSPSDAEYALLHSRVIALENIIIALLAEASDRQIELVREMAAYIAPRDDAVQHPLTVHAASQMDHVVDRSKHFRILFSS